MLPRATEGNFSGVGRMLFTRVSLSISGSGSAEMAKVTFWTGRCVKARALQKEKKIVFSIMQII